MAAVQLDLGQVVFTPGALEALLEAGQSAVDLLHRHARGDWGEVDTADWQENDHSVTRGLRVLSAYTLTAGVKVWIITEADRSATTILLPEEY